MDEHTPGELTAAIGSAEIENLKAEVKRLRSALREIATYGMYWDARKCAAEAYQALNPETKAQ